MVKITVKELAQKKRALIQELKELNNIIQILEANKPKHPRTVAIVKTEAMLTEAAIDTLKGATFTAKDGKITNLEEIEEKQTEVQEFGRALGVLTNELDVRNKGLKILEKVYDGKVKELENLMALQITYEMETGIPFSDFL